MATHDYIISNQTFPSTRSDINNVLEAIVSKNSSGTEPATTYAYMWWYDTATTTLKIRNRDDDAWISFASFDQDNDTVNFLDSEVSIAGITTSATGTVLTLTDSTVISSVDFIIDNQKEIRFREQTGNGTNYVALKAPASISSDLTFTLPSTDGASGQALVTNGSGVLSFASAGLAWQSVQTTGFTAVAGNGYPCNTTSAGFTVTLPANATAGDTIVLVDYAGTFATNNLTLGANGNKIEGETSNKKLTTNREAVTLTYVDSTQGWVASSGVNSGLEALDPNTYSIDFLVIAGGGAGASSGNGGGGGAGGYRLSTQTVTAGTVITVTVGDGGASVTGNVVGNDGSNSSISGSGLTTITSAGGGGGGTPSFVGRNGGSGGGGGNDRAGGSGNTPSTSPSQGNNGGLGVQQPDAYGAGGGGGAGAVGANGTSTAGGNGGAGTASSITGSSVTRAGGGGANCDVPFSVGTGGAGGGGDSGNNSPSTNGTAGTANTGSGGGASKTPNNSGAGGKGVVILSVPTGSYSSTTTGSPTVTTSGSNTIMQFNGSGSYTA